MGNIVLKEDSTCRGEIVVYQPDEVTRLEVRVNEDTVWLTQAQMALLFQTTPQNITIHIRNVYKEGELEESPTCKEYLQVQSEGTRIVRRIQKVYNLDVIISVGYRVKSIRCTQFRQWANKVLKEYLLRRPDLRCICVCLKPHKVGQNLPDTDRQLHRRKRPDDALQKAGWRNCRNPHRSSHRNLEAGSCQT